jgi:hypothetical protein
MTLSAESVLRCSIVSRRRQQQNRKMKKFEGKIKFTIQSRIYLSLSRSLRDVKM